MPLVANKQTVCALRLLAWHRGSQPNYPWRRTRDPFAVLLSEILLRKTTRRQALGVFDSFRERYPTVESLHRATVGEIENEIRPLGMQKERAWGLKRMASALIREHAGRVPDEKTELMSLPLVGQYTTNAVMCFAFGKDLPLVDTNVARVVSRVFSLNSKKKRPHEDDKLWEFVGALIPKGKAREFNFAILDFGDSICSKLRPKCAVCPMLSICEYARKRERGRLLQAQTVRR